MKNVADIEYKNDGLFTRFYPNTQEGVSVWNSIAQNDDNGLMVLLTIHAKNFIKQARAAGYSVSKCKPIKISDDDLLDALDA